MKGVVFTLEALITFSFFAAVLMGAKILVQPPAPPVPLYETVLLNDFCQVLELNYHGETAEFIITKGESVPPGLAEYLEFIEEKTGKRMFLEYGKRTSECEPLIQSERLFAFPSFSYYQEQNLVGINYFHKLKVGICK